MKNGQEKSPISVSTLAGDDTLDRACNSEVLDFPHRIERYGRARKRAVEMGDYLSNFQLPLSPVTPIDPLLLPDVSLEEQVKKATIRLKDCGNWLHFRNYHTEDKIRLIKASFCRMHLLCPLCAIRRGAKNLAAYLKKYEQIREENPNIRAYLITPTVVNRPDLDDAFNHLKKSLKTLIERRRKFLSGKTNRPIYTELSKVLGAVYTFEVTNKGKGWHPHVHMLALCEEAPSQAKLREEWKSITGDSYILDVRPFRVPLDGSPEQVSSAEVQAFVEVFKYALKFSDLSLSDNWEAYTILKGQRLIGSLGLFRSVKVSEDLTDELEAEEQPYIDLLYRYFSGHYHLTKIF
jgi:hypothetical protein